MSNDECRMLTMMVRHRDSGRKEARRSVGRQRGDAPQEAGVLPEPRDEHPPEPAVRDRDCGLRSQLGDQAQVLTKGRS